MRIAFFGVPDLGIICLNTLMQNNKNIVVVVPPPIDHPAHGLMVEAARLHGIPSVIFNKSLKEKEFIKAFKQFSPDIAVVCAFNNKIPKEVLDIPPQGFINCHPSLLPEYRGGNPYFHVILNNETKTGTTIHYMDENFDTGDIITQEELPIEPDETLGLLFHKLNMQCAKLITEVIDKIDNNYILTRTPQDTTKKYKTAPIIDLTDIGTSINWSKDCFYIDRFVRACNPFFGAKSLFRGSKVIIWSGKCHTDTVNYINTKYEPGTFVGVNKDGLIIATGKGFYTPTCIQIDNLLITDIKDFIKRTNPKLGEIFSSIESHKESTPLNS